METRTSVNPSNSKRSYKYCFVSRCKSTTVATPQKKFLAVPRIGADYKLRRKWFAACRGSDFVPETRSVFYCCEDHFTDSDYENLMEHQMMGTRLTLKRGAVPSKFSWREHRLRPKRPIQWNFKKRQNEVPSKGRSSGSMVQYTSKNMWPSITCTTIRRKTGNSGSITQKQNQIFGTTQNSGCKKQQQNLNASNNIGPNIKCTQIKQIHSTSSELKHLCIQNVEKTSLDLIKTENGQTEENESIAQLQILQQNQILSTTQNSGPIVQQQTLNIPIWPTINHNQVQIISTTSNIKPIIQQQNRSILKKILPKVANTDGNQILANTNGDQILTNTNGDQILSTPGSSGFSSQQSSQDIEKNSELKTVVLNQVQTTAANSPFLILQPYQNFINYEIKFVNGQQILTPMVNTVPVYQPNIIMTMPVGLQMVVEKQRSDAAENIGSPGHLCIQNVEKTSLDLIKTEDGEAEENESITQRMSQMIEPISLDLIKTEPGQDLSLAEEDEPITQQFSQNNEPISLNLIKIEDRQAEENESFQQHISQNIEPISLDLIKTEPVEENEYITQQMRQNIGPISLDLIKTEPAEENESIIQQMSLDNDSMSLDLIEIEDVLSIAQQPSQNIKKTISLDLESYQALSTAVSNGFITEESNQNVETTPSEVTTAEGNLTSCTTEDLSHQSSQDADTVPRTGDLGNPIYRHIISPQMLPPSFKNVIIEENDEKIVIRSNIQSMDDIKTWLYEFEDITRTKWNTRYTMPKGRRMICKKMCICHLSSFMKVEADKNKRLSSKNTGCNARLRFNVKLYTMNTKRTDKYVKVGLLGVITLDLHHNHSLDSPEVLRLLPLSVPIKKKFVEYFNSGLGCVKAKECHESYLMLRENFTEKDLTCGRLNPSIRAVRMMYRNWKLRKPRAKKKINESSHKISKGGSKKDVAWTNKLLSALTCEQIPDGSEPQIFAIEIKEESLSTAAQNVLNNFAQKPTTRRSRRLLRPPAIIQEEIVSSEGEL